MKRSEMLEILGQAILEAIPSEAAGSLTVDAEHGLTISVGSMSIDTEHVLRVLEDVMLPPCSKKGYYRWEDEDNSDVNA